MGDHPRFPHNLKNPTQKYFQTTAHLHMRIIILLENLTIESILNVLKNCSTLIGLLSIKKQNSNHCFKSLQF
jgi:hypothetical protein